MEEQAKWKSSLKKKWLRRMPLIIVLTIYSLTAYFLFWSWTRISSMALTQYTGKEMFVMPSLFGRGLGIHLLWIPFVAIVSILGWVLSTRVPKLKGKFTRLVLFAVVFLTNAGMVTGYGMTKVQDYVIPFFYARISRVIDTDDVVSKVLFEQTNGFFFMLLMMPIILLLFIGMFVMTKYRQHDEDLKEAFFKFEWKGERLRYFESLSNIEDSIVPLPDVELGIGVETGEMVTIPAMDRALNTNITGSIGTGKSAALGLPMINQDLHHFTRFINDYSRISKMENYKSEEIQGRYLNGLSIIEPSNDLCKQVFKLAKAHGIPDEAITYIDPTNPKTPSINVMRGPTDKVAEVFAQVISGLADSGSGGNFYFEQAQRNHLKHHIYLLKMHDPTKDVTFDMLLDMYSDTQIVRKMHLDLKARFPVGYENIDKEERRDEYNYWQILRTIDKWFDKVIIPLEKRVGNGFQVVTNDNGEVVYIDAEEVHVKGLRNILNDIGANPLIRRVLFGTSKFNFDDHMGTGGGILLVNTAKGELEALGSVLGKIILMSLQNASFRREPKVSAFHHILVDEAPEYYYSSFSSFPAQSRKYKVIISTLQQTLTQLRGAFGEDYMNTVVAAMRNRMVYADVSNFDAKYFAEMFGEKDVYRESESEQSVSPLQENPVSRSGSTYSKVKEAAMSSSDILFQDAFECAVKIVVNNKTMPVQKIKANFVPKDEFEKAVVQVKPSAAKKWLKLRDESSIKVDDFGIVYSTEDEEATPLQQKEETEEGEVLSLLSEEHTAELEKAIQSPKPTRPSKTEVQYNEPPAVYVPQMKTNTEKINGNSKREPKVEMKEMDQNNKPEKHIVSVDKEKEQLNRKEETVIIVNKNTVLPNEIETLEVVDIKGKSKPSQESIKPLVESKHPVLETIDIGVPRKRKVKEEPQKEVISKGAVYQEDLVDEKTEDFLKSLEKTANDTTQK
ncbi:TraM recognition domain-containing protein [Lysinibacillus sp. CNPSo 3705]|uniref:type IV secretory system conjugative DNA transfer family protein n=1 Tax=Lysinibacillus sp. CNPSo 3705 TaxID=3028148 RepID=UPI002363DD2D|nr:TraM recognition domain-containing protein [Lysinibacillus sp. CNPSo 3705]MDD1505216.1 TraM recognition domain-containing protein [Lysinibacillus sp. CNPSo 3705]